MPSVYFQTFGCQMNAADSDAVRALLAKRGFVPCDSPIGSDLIVVNTCSVREAAERRAKSRIAEFARGKRARAGQRLWVVGCMAERLGDKLKGEIPGVDLVIGAKEVGDLGRMGGVIDAYLSEWVGGGGVNKGKSTVDDDDISRGKSATGDIDTGADIGVSADLGADAAVDTKSATNNVYKAAVTDFVPVMRGCDNYCAYCIVPYVRGSEQSMPYESIELAVKKRVGAGIKEITFLGQNVNSYNYNGMDFPELLSKMAEISGLERIRFTTSHPKDCTERLIDVVASSKKFASHIHLPVQAGSDRVLALMNRKYTVRSYRNLLDMIRARLPHADITSDIMVGFPTESGAEFRETLDLVRAARFTTAFMFAYSKRAGTAAASMEEGISQAEKMARLSELVALQTEITREIYEKAVGEELEVLVTERQQKRDLAWMGQDAGCKRVLISCESLAAGMIFKGRAVRSSGMTLIVG